ncbi:MAG: hypothetical protein RI907_3197 [Pseudomonadota bacterium]|jgi:hypothetical protein
MKTLPRLFAATLALACLGAHAKSTPPVLTTTSISIKDGATFSLSANSDVVVDFTWAGKSSSFDKLKGEVTLDGKNVEFSSLLKNATQIANGYELVFANVLAAKGPYEFKFDGSSNYKFTISASPVVIAKPAIPSPVPEPQTYALAAIGVAVALVARRKAQR